jgi:hypothetical protein
MAEASSSEPVGCILAEEVGVAATIADLTWLFEGRVEHRLLPLLDIAWREGLDASRVGDGRPAAPPAPGPVHGLTVIPFDAASGPSVARYRFQWNAVGADALFSSYVGILSIQADECGIVMSLRGTARLVAGHPLPGRARRPEETVVRSLLGHLRNAAEQMQHVPR